MAAVDIRKHVRPDGLVNVRYPDGEIKQRWPIDVRQDMGAQKLELMPVGATPTGPTLSPDTRELQPKPARAPGRSAQPEAPAAS